MSIPSLTKVVFIEADSRRFRRILYTNDNFATGLARSVFSCIKRDGHMIVEGENQWAVAGYQGNGFSLSE